MVTAGGVVVGVVVVTVGVDVTSVTVGVVEIIDGSTYVPGIEVPPTVKTLGTSVLMLVLMFGVTCGVT